MTGKVPEHVSRKMRGNVSADTKPELILRKRLWKLGLRGYRKNYKKLTGKPDIYYPSKKLVIMVNGCFWHRCPYCKLHIPKVNTAFWIDKFELNVNRDKKIKAILEEKGIKVEVVWECEIEHKLEEVTNRILRLFLEKG